MSWKNGLHVPATSFGVHGTSGGSRPIMFEIPETGKLQERIEPAHILKPVLFQISIAIQTTIHGSSALQSRDGLSATSPSGSGGGAGAMESFLPRRIADVQTCFGRQLRKNRTRQPIESSAAPISTIDRLPKFEIANCAIANEAPLTTIAGQTATMP